MSETTYIVKEPVSGEVWAPSGPITFAIAAGEALSAPASEAERLILEHLIAAGRAEPAPAKPTKKET